MQRTQNKEQFPKILVAVIGTMCCAFITFGTVCYMTFGPDMDEQIITEMLPADNYIVIALKLIFCINMVFSYIIHIKPCNMIIEAWVFKPTDNMWLINASRFFVCLLGAMGAVLVADKLDKFFGLLGALLCAPVAFIVPACLHYKMLAKSKAEKRVDILLVVLSFSILVFCTA